MYAIVNVSLIFIVLILDFPCVCCFTLTDASHASTLKPSCIAFHAQHKAAGFTIVRTLRREPLSGYRKKKSHNFRCDDRQMDVLNVSCKPPATFPMKAPYILTGGYALTMANHNLFNHRRCTWITMFREPVSRLVSAYFHCKRHPRDPLCGSNRLRAASATIEEWAEHWGNFLFRELLLYPPILEHAMPRTLSVGCNALCAAHWQNPHDKFWYKWKLALGEGQNLESKAGRRNMQLVEQHLRGNGVHRMYDTFGIMTEFNKSMWLFDHSAPLHMTWAQLAAKHYSNHRSVRDKQKMEHMKQAARKNKRVVEALKADLTIYAKIIAPLSKNLTSSIDSLPDFKTNSDFDLD